MRVKKQQLELDMEQQTGSKSGKEYVEAGKVVYVSYIYFNKAGGIFQVNFLSTIVLFTETAQ